MRGNVDTSDQRVQPVLNAVARVQASHRGFRVAEFGYASATHDLNKTIGQDFSRAESLSVPITFLILLFAFGAFVAAGVPVLLAFSAVLGSIGLNELVSHLAHASSATQSVILLMGMAVGVDYSLFYLKREREERAAGNEGHEAVFRAAATSGQAVLYLRLDGAGRDGRDALRGLEDLHLARDRRDARGLHLAARLTHGATGAARQARGEGIDRGVRQVLAAGTLGALRPLRVAPRWIVSGCATHPRF